MPRPRNHRQHLWLPSEAEKSPSTINYSKSPSIIKIINQCSPCSRKTSPPTSFPVRTQTPKKHGSVFYSSQALQGGNMPTMGLPISLPQLRSTLLVGTAQDRTSVAALQTQFQIHKMMNRNNRNNRNLISDDFIHKMMNRSKN